METLILQQHHFRAILFSIAPAPDGWYYLTYTAAKESRGVKDFFQLWRSRDLANWEDCGYIWKAEDSKWLTPEVIAAAEKELNRKFRLWGPELHLVDGRWVIPHNSNIRKNNLMVTRGLELKPPLDEPMAGAFPPGRYYQSNCSRNFTQVRTRKA